MNDFGGRLTNRPLYVIVDIGPWVHFLPKGEMMMTAVKMVIMI